MLKVFLLTVLIAAAFLVCMRFYERRSLYFPGRAIDSTPASSGLAFSEEFFLSSDGTRLCGWYIPAENPRATVLYCHGNAGNISHRIDIARAFNKLGLNFFIFDYRGYGKSGGRPYEAGLYSDALAAYGFLIKEKGADPQKIIFYGKSLGGAVAVDLSLKKRPAILILESSFASVNDMAHDMYGRFPMWLFVTQKFDALSKIGKVTSPKLFIHSRKDEVVPFAHSERLFKAAPPPKEFLESPSGHDSVLYAGGDEFPSKIGVFINKYLR